MHVGNLIFGPVNISIVNSELTGPDDPLSASRLTKLTMTQEGSEYFVKILIKNLTRDERTRSIAFVLCGIRCTYSLLGILTFVRSKHTCEHATTNMIKLSDATFHDSRLSLYNSEEAASLIISNVLFRNASFYKSCDFHLILHNATFQDDGSFWSMGNMTIQGLFVYQRCIVGIRLSTKFCSLIIDKNAHVMLIDNNMPYRDAPFTVFFLKLL